MDLEQINLEETTETIPNIKDIIINNDGSFSYNNKKLLNNQLQQIFDYTKYDNGVLKTRVEGIFTHDVFKIGNITYPTTLNKNGDLVSVDGKNIITHKELEKIMGPSYKALLCKTTKNITITPENKIIINDKVKKSLLDLTEKSKKNQITNTATNNKAKKIVKEDEKNQATKSHNKTTVTPSISPISTALPPSQATTISTNTQETTQSSTASNNKEEAQKTSTPNSSSSTSSVSTNLMEFTTTTGNNEIISVDFDGLNNIIDDLKKKKAQLSTICENYQSQITSLSTSNVWEGADKDYFITQKNTYALNLEDLVSTFLTFIECLETYQENYTNLENTLSAKTIS